MKPLNLWCETCEGTGVIHEESQLGVTGSGGQHRCPDCDGNGYIESVQYQRVPEGWQLVPVEPDNKMRFAGAKAPSGAFMTPSDAESCYRYMLAAAPKVKP